MAANSALPDPKICKFFCTVLPMQNSPPYHSHNVDYAPWKGLYKGGHDLHLADNLIQKASTTYSSALTPQYLDAHLYTIRVLIQTHSNNGPFKRSSLLTF